MPVFVLHRLAVALAALLTVLPTAAFAQTGASSPSNETTAVITGQGVVSRQPDTAVISATITTNDDVAATATAKNNAIFAAVTAALPPPLAADVKTTFYNVTYNPRPAALADAPRAAPYPFTVPRYGYLVNRQITITLSRVADVGSVVDSVVHAGVTGIGGVQYVLKDRAAANEAALALALADAANQARVVAASTHMQLGGIKQIQVGQNYGGFPTPLPMRVPAQDGPVSTQTQLQPAPLDVRASAVVTYYLKP